MHEMQNRNLGWWEHQGNFIQAMAATAMACCCMNLLLIEHFFNNLIFKKAYVFEPYLCHVDTK